MEIGKVKKKTGYRGEGWGGSISPKYVFITKIFLFILHFSWHYLTKVVFKLFILVN